MENSLISGVITVDKPANVSSAWVVAKVKRILKARKVGHTGTLDPMATGVLVCCINKATRIAQFLIQNKKRYCATLHLGIETDTQDATGKVVANMGIGEVNVDQISRVIKEFEGSYLQSPPAFSALKMNGIPLYRYARSGRPVHKPPRQVMIDAIDIISIEMPYVHFDVTCSSGTYVRSLCADIGKKLCCGGHLQELRRTECGRFTIDNALTIPEIETFSNQDRISEKLISMTDALPEMPEIKANKSLTLQIKHGRVIRAFDIKELSPKDHDDFAGPQQHIKVLGPKRNLLAILKHNRQKEKFDYVCVFNENIH
jgi:tRNA pseudouridine55 synthase